MDDDMANVNQMDFHDWRNALEQLGAGNPVYREGGMADDQYVEPEFALRGAAPDLYPYKNGNGEPFRLALCNDRERVGLYEPTEADKAATNWELA